MFDNRLDDESVASVLPEFEQARLAKILDEYLKAIEQGTPVDPQELLAQHPDDAGRLAGYLSGLKYFHTMAVESVFNAESTEYEPITKLKTESRSLREIGDFQLLEEIGRGGMGIVYDAIQVSLGRRVALKVLPFTKKHGQQIQRFKNEARAAACVEHPNIVPVHSVGEEDGVHFFAMQLIEGQSLSAILEDLIDHANQSNEIQDDAIASPSTVSSTADHIRSIARLGRQAADALHAAHEVGVIHRDIKPSNLLVDDHGKLWVTDFGLASCRDTTGITKTGDVLGTMRYMSPEQSRGENELIDRRTDIYSLGVTMYELASLHHPSGAISDLQVFASNDSPKQHPLRSWNRQIPRDFQTIIMKSLAAAPADRYSTASDLAEDLSRFIDGRPIQATPPTLMDQAGKFVKRHRKMATLLGLIFIASVMAQSFNNILLQNSNREKEQALVRAHQNLQQAHAVLDRFGTRLVDQLVAIPGAEGIRYQLLNDSLNFYELFEARAKDGDEWATELAHAYSKMGSLSEKMGRGDVALEKHSAALQLWQTQYKQQPHNRPVARNVALCLNNVGLIWAENEHQDRAIEMLTEARQIQNSLILAEFEIDSVGIELATTANNLGTVFHRAGDTDKAIESFDDALASQEKLSDAARASDLNLRSLAVSHNNLAAIYRGTELRKAESHYRNAIKIQLQLIKTDPINRIYQAELGCTYNNLGYLHAAQADWPTAEAAYQDANAIREHLVRSSPHYATYRRDLAITCNNLGMAQSQLRQNSDAESSFAASIKLLSELTIQQPDGANTISDLGGAYNNLGLLRARQYRFTEAEDAFRSAIDSQQQAFQLSRSKRHRELLSNHYVNYSGLLRNDLHRIAEADEISKTRQILLANNSE